MCLTGKIWPMKILLGLKGTLAKISNSSEILWWFIKHDGVPFEYQKCHLFSGLDAIPLMKIW